MRLKRSWKWLLGGVVAVVVAIPVGTYLYIHVFSDDPPPPLTLETAGASDTTIADETTTTTLATATAEESTTSTSVAMAATDATNPSTTIAVTTTTAAPSTGIAGTYAASSGSTVGYRVKEVLFGQSTEGVGRTSDVTGSLTIVGSTVSAVSLTADMTTVTSDKSQRDGQFQGRIMETSTFPTATFKLTTPIALGSVPADGVIISTRATGDLTLHGVTKRVTFTLKAVRAGSSIKVNGSIPVVFADYDIDNPSGGPATTEDNGTIEFLVVFTPK